MRISFRHSLVSFFCVALFCIAHTASATTGFVDSPLWLTPESPKEGDMVTLSAVFRNAETENLSGTVVFYDGQVLLGKKAITVPSAGVATAVISFKIGAGDHSFSASMTNTAKISTAGTSTPFSTPIETAELPKQFIAKKISTVSSDTSSTDFSAPILERVNEVQDKALSVVPVGVKQSVTITTGKIDAWRGSEAVSLEKNKVATQKIVDAKKTAPAKSETSLQKITDDDGPLVYVKLVWFSVMAFLFSNPYIFYGVGIFLLFLILRFFYRKIRGR
jgi:hypothetical protein